MDEDFVVEERANLQLEKEGDFKVYLLRKKGWNTTDLINYISRILKIPLSSVSYGGKKDRHGLTSQFITIKSKKDFSMQGENFSLEFIGFTSRPMGPDLIISNNFNVTIRNIRETEEIFENLDEIKEFGIPNFFDDQRFRSYDFRRGFFAEKILKKQWNGALQVFLTSVSPDMKANERRRKEELFRNWKNWEKCLEIAETKLEKKIFNLLKEGKKNLLKALHMIPREEVSMLYSSYQSHLWNEILRRLIKIKILEIYEIKGVEGGYFFWKKLERETFSYLKELKIPTASHKMDFFDPTLQEIYNELLKEKQLKRSSFRTTVLRKAYFRSFQRKALVIPEGLRVLEEDEDELNRGKRKIKIEFSLPRGSYGTIVTKRLEAKWKKH